ncbi:RNA polymerase sigma-70 factor [Gillisia sp. M10.2A]|uniref:RNA polymerase sigma factor n=1 Tax=Gillisia lutea TaxID=2909668 RepID=A0ABS9ED12_9FLAO|nr:RNA polymerase sigma-70 factor [Gillisia lutea]MCF4100775.1 RNA polymerase sigma-70 factor [Gillisia lutea]
MKEFGTGNTDKLLVGQLISGDEHAFRQLYLTYKNDIYAFCFAMLKSKTYAEEVVQEVFLRVWLNRNDLNVDLSFKSFIFTIARNLTFNFLNKASNEKDLHKEIFYKAEKFSYSTDQFMDEVDYNHIKNQALDLLPPKRKIIFQMSRIDGHSYEEISTELGISLSTVKNQMSKALATIRQYLEVNSDITTLIFLLLSDWVH